MTTFDQYENDSMLELDKSWNPDFEQWLGYCMTSGRIDPNLYQEYDVKRGLRDSTGKGVLTGLTEISDVSGHKIVDGRRIPVDGSLYYQGYSITDLINSHKNRRFAFEETTYLLLFGSLPTRKQLDSFLKIACLEGQDVTDTLEQLKKIGDLFHITFTISISLEEKDIPESMKECIVVSL